ncbi:MAG: tRNA preQ1(34) S-adenosylmethionine ribosyltransferase-isomerase QueA [Bacteroidetes bacterium]|nr:tRNA preQ1(34) S-adenosylmethionine ribosyltransferase-isomerase QueA [Bacteroidota bacterium]MCL5025565.1 tRNA preQ1(34) S-adenosylmethionine ribosyltransferase-isomerase QueA [Chloroflexota bacterium]
MKTSDFDYRLPPKLIAQTPIEPRDASRLLVLHRKDQRIEHRQFRDIAGYLRPGDLLVANQSRVIPARLLGRKRDTGGRVEVLLVRRREPGLWETLAKPGRRVRRGTLLEFGTENGSLHTECKMVERTDAGGWLVRFGDEAALEAIGGVPLPPYIHRPLADPERYQTVYARVKGSVAAPTAGLHFTPALMDDLERMGVQFAFLTLHIGLDTFRPVQVEDPAQHQLHAEFGELSPEAAAAVNAAHARGNRVIAVGTTAVRLLESAADEAGRVGPYAGWTRLFITPGYRFRAVDALITNFHLPRSTLLMLVSAFAGREFVLRAYGEAVAERYRFYSFGDATLIL